MSFKLNGLSKSSSFNDKEENKNINNIDLFTQSNFKDYNYHSFQRTKYQYNIITYQTPKNIGKHRYNFSSMISPNKNQFKFFPKKTTLKQIKLNTIYGTTNHNNINEQFKVEQKNDCYLPTIEIVRKNIRKETRIRKATYVPNEDHKEIISGEMLRQKLMKRNIDNAKKILIETHAQVNMTQRRLKETFDDLKGKIENDYNTYKLNEK